MSALPHLSGIRQTAVPARRKGAQFITCSSKLHSIQDREDKRMATKQYKQYGEEPCSAVDEGIDLNAT